MAGSFSPNATTGTVHHPTPLTDLSLTWRPSTGVMIADQVFPVKPVKHESDTYYKWNKGQRFRVTRSDGQGSQRADRTAARLRNYGFTEDSYKLYEYALAESTTDREKANADDALSLEESRIHGIQDELMLDYEIRVANIIRTAANYAAANTTTLAGVNQWNNASFASLNSNGLGHSTIKANLDAGKKAVIAATGGILPNTIVLPYEVAIVMNNDPGLIDKEKYTLSTLLSTDMLDLENPPKLWGMRVLIPTVQFQTTTEGEPDALGAVWGKDVWMGFVNPRIGLNSLTFGLTFRKGGFDVRSWREEKSKENMYECSLLQTEKLVAADCGYLIKNAIA